MATQGAAPSHRAGTHQPAAGVYGARPGVYGSGNFLYLALQALKDLEHRVQFEAEALGFQRAFQEIGPANDGVF